MNCLIILLLLCCCGNSNNGVSAGNSCNCREKCNHDARENESCEEVRGDKSCEWDRDKDRACECGCDEHRHDNRGNDCRRDYDSCDDYGRGRREDSWKDYSDYRHSENYSRNDSCDCECK